MSRLIDADEFSRVLIEHMIAPFEYNDYDKGLYDASLLLKNTPTIDLPHWIPCSERLPEKNGRYIVTRGLNACGTLWNRVYIVNYSNLMGLKTEKIWWNGNVGKSDFTKYDDVLAWIPLPEPYRGESDV